MSTPDAVAEVRAFNRFYTTVIGVLNEGLLASPYSLTEVRVMFELSHRGETDVVDLRRDLGLDAGYLSRIVARLEGEGLITRRKSPLDARRLVLALTSKGRRQFARLDQRSADEVHTLLGRLGEGEQRRLLGSMRAIQSVLGSGAGSADAGAAVVLRPLRPGDMGWVVQQQGRLYSEEYGWDETYEALVARIVADYGDQHDRRRETAWIAELDGEPVGSVFCVRDDDDTARLRLLGVERSARGRGIGARLVDECIRFAHHAGYHRMVLWTVSLLESARRIYEAAGFELVEEEKLHRFGHDLVGQTWALDLSK